MHVYMHLWPISCKILYHKAVPIYLLNCFHFYLFCRWNNRYSVIVFIFIILTDRYVESIGSSFAWKLVISLLWVCVCGLIVHIALTMKIIFIFIFTKCNFIFFWPDRKLYQTYGLFLFLPDRIFWASEIRIPTN